MSYIIQTFIFLYLFPHKINSVSCFSGYPYDSLDPLHFFLFLTELWAHSTVFYCGSLQMLSSVAGTEGEPA